MKGNVDAELVLHSAAIEYDNYDEAIIISGDGDFACLVEYLKEKRKLEMLVVPNEFKYSALLKRFNDPDRKFIFFLNRLQNKLEYLPKNEKGA